MTMLAGCGGHETAARTGAAGATEPFDEVAASVGIDFTHFNGMSGEFYMPEMVGPGGALFDYDNDGDLDVFIVQGEMLGPNKTYKDALFPPRCPLPPRARLYRNDLTVHPDGTRTLHFTDVTEASGLDVRGYALGVATGDINNDGWLDLFVTKLGAQQLLLNNGNGTFRDATDRIGRPEERWSTSAAFLDYDRDGWLDLFVCNYVQFNFQIHRTCNTSSGARDYCGPQVYTPEPDRLLHNRGDGTFEDVSLAAGIAAKPGPALGVVCADLNGDGWVDIYVANDGAANFYWVNQHDGTFLEEAVLSGCAYNRNGVPEASMGVDAGDFDADGDEDLFMTHIEQEKNTLYVNNGKGQFIDASGQHGVEGPSRGFTGFGTAWLDYDNDGWLDLLVANGAVKKVESLVRAGDPFPLHQRNKLLRNLGNGQFVDASSGKAFELSEVSRGAAFGDIDNDGDNDVLILNDNGPARLLMNRVGQDRHWIGLRLVGPDGKRDMLGARVAVFRPSGPTLWRRAHTDGSYCSANDPRVLVGLGDDPRVDTIHVQWPSGTIEQWTGIATGKYTTLREGTGQAVGDTTVSAR
jgi:hypothetical protein